MECHTKATEPNKSGQPAPDTSWIGHHNGSVAIFKVFSNTPVNCSKGHKLQKCTEQGKNLETIIGRKHSFQKELVFISNEKQFDFAGPLPDQ